MDDIYTRLMKRMDKFPMGAPPSENLLNLLRIIFEEDEAELALDLSPNPERLSDIATRLGREKSELEALLERMADKGLVYCRDRAGEEKCYNLLPLLPGIFEMQFMKAEVTKKKVAELFDAYYHEGWRDKTFTFKTPLTRILPVEEEIVPRQEVLPYEKVSAYIRDSVYMALTNCFCRHEAELLGRSCGRPKDVCMVFGPFAEFLVKRGYARKATKEMMLDALDRAEKAGLVHITDNVQDKIGFICNCCGCCCGFLGAMTKLGYPKSVVGNSRYLPVVDEDLCNGCETCVEVCQVGAVKLQDEIAHIEQERCIGCGLCVSHCPAEAMEISTREDWSEPKANHLELGTAILSERDVV